LFINHVGGAIVDHVVQDLNAHCTHIRGDQPAPLHTKTMKIQRVRNPHLVVLVDVGHMTKHMVGIMVVVVAFIKQVAGDASTA
jgi:hypothetical protein